MKEETIFDRSIDSIPAEERTDKIDTHITQKETLNYTHKKRKKEKNPTYL